MTNCQQRRNLTYKKNVRMHGDVGSIVSVKGLKKSQSKFLQVMSEQ